MIGDCVSIPAEIYLLNSYLTYESYVLIELNTKNLFDLF